MRVNDIPVYEFQTPLKPSTSEAICSTRTFKFQRKFFSLILSTENRVNTTKIIIIHSSRRHSINSLFNNTVAEYILRQIWLRDNCFNDFEENFIFFSPQESWVSFFNIVPNWVGGLMHPWFLRCLWSLVIAIAYRGDKPIVIIIITFFSGTKNCSYEKLGAVRHLLGKKTI